MFISNWEFKSSKTYFPEATIEKPNLTICFFTYDYNYNADND
jgi:hypothetical protein